MVHLRGLVQNSDLENTNNVIESIIFTLPQGYRPQAASVYLVASGNLLRPSPNECRFPGGRCRERQTRDRRTAFRATGNLWPGRCDGQRRRRRPLRKATGVLFSRGNLVQSKVSRHRSRPSAEDNRCGAAQYLAHRVCSTSRSLGADVGGCKRPVGGADREREAVAAPRRAWHGAAVRRADGGRL